MEHDDLERMRASTAGNPDLPGLARLRADCARDGVDAAVIFANRGFLGFYPSDPELSLAMAHAWNVWATSVYFGNLDQFMPMAMVPTGTPPGICTIDSSESSPCSAWLCTGTPNTGRMV